MQRFLDWLFPSRVVAREIRSRPSVPNVAGVTLNDLVHEVEWLVQDNQTDAMEMLLAVMEELGEVSTGLHVERYNKGRKLAEPLKVEAVDVLISAFGLYYALGGSQEELPEHFQAKLKKYRERLDKEQLKERFKAVWNVRP